MDVEQRDTRFRRLSTVGALLNFVGVVFALVAVTSYHWAKLTGLALGYMGPFMVCQSIPGGYNRCERGGMGPYRQSWASYTAGTGAVVCTLLMGVSTILGVLVVAMHFAKHQICLKFRHATMIRMSALAGAAIGSLISFVCFILEAKVFLKMQSGEVADLSWSFYMEIIAFAIAFVCGMMSNVETKWGRKLGGDPTIFSRDPEGTKADTIENKNFREAPRREGGASPTETKEIHRNHNGVAMTRISGLPYMVTGNGSVPKKKGQNGHLNGRGYSNSPRTEKVAFDPNRAPGRSSLRRPKKREEVVQQQVFMSGSQDTLDSQSSEAAATIATLKNPSFANSSPVMKKKVRIHTQSTAV